MKKVKFDTLEGLSIETPIGKVNISPGPDFNGQPTVTVEIITGIRVFEVRNDLLPFGDRVLVYRKGTKEQS